MIKLPSVKFFAKYRKFFNILSIILISVRIICYFIEIDILLSEFLKEYDPFSEVEKKIFSEQEENGEYYLIEEIE